MKKFISSLMDYIEKRQKKLNEFNKNLDEQNKEWENMNEEEKIEAITRETEISTLKWIRDKIMEYLE